MVIVNAIAIVMMIISLYLSYKEKAYIIMVIASIALGVNISNFFHKLAPSEKEILKIKLIRNFEGKIPQNGKIIFETTYCFKDDEISEILFNGECPE